MKSTLKEQLGAVLLPVLDPFHKVDGCSLISVWETSIEDDLEEISLEFESGFLTILVDSDDDTIDISLTRKPGKSSKPASDLLPWKNKIGHSFGWGGIGINQQGYLDGVTLSFGSVTPQFSITAIASSLVITQNHSVIKRRAPQSKLDKQTGVITFAKTA